MTSEQLQIYELQDRLEEVESRLSGAIRQSYRNTAVLAFVVFVLIVHPTLVQWLIAIGVYAVIVETGVRRIVPPRRPTPRYSQQSPQSSLEQKQTS